MSTSCTPDKQVSNFIAKIRAAISHHALIVRGDKVIVGVSGGPDSLALLHVLCALRDELQITLHVAHLNHQLRAAASQADADFVATIAREWQLDATIESRDVIALAQAEHLSIEEAARHARYAFLAEVAQKQGASVVAVAHNRDDQVETVVMHLMRGSGLAGLRGMTPRSRVSGFTVSSLKPETLKLETGHLALVRPLLDVTRAEIEEYVHANGLAPRQDQSNLDTTFFRNRLRHEVLPYLESLNPNLREVLYHSALSIADDYDFLDVAIESEFSKVAHEQDGAIVFSREAWRALHPALQRGTLRAAVHRLRGNLRDLNWVHVEDARQIALEKNAGAVATLPNGLLLVVGYDDFIIADAKRAAPLPDLPLLHVDELVLPENGVTALPDSNWVIETKIISQDVISTSREAARRNLFAENEISRSARNDRGGIDRWTATYDFAMCRGEKKLRRRRAGDRFQPIGMQGHSRSLHEFMIDEKIQRAVRDLLPLLIVGDRIAWVCGWRVDERVRVTENTSQFWRVTFRKM
ncbi:MAG: tRNA lysidine(34) synthetase TilS [Chloroflexi bacterium]|nr:tRNA lysidine(34) synthetase TilS [Chloroflexota bacterium]